MNNTPLKQIALALQAAQKLLIVTHIYPDADAIGSASALWLALRQMGKDVQFYLPGEVPYKMVKLAKDINIQYSIPADKFDALIIVDCANLSRMGDDAQKIVDQAGQVICLDHHFSHEAFADLSFIDSVAPASAVIVLALIEALEAEITAPLADLLYAGLCDDTGCFRWSSTTAETFEQAAKLVQYGARPDLVAKELYFTVPERIFKLRGMVLEKMQTYCDGKITLIKITQEDLDQVNASASDADGLIDEIKMLASAVMAVLIKETDKGWKFSLRSKNMQLDVNALAAKWGGGGHKMAAGYTVQGNVDEAIANLVSETKQIIDALGLS